jgi:hypothetical protein
VRIGDLVSSAQGIIFALGGNVIRAIFVLPGLKCAPKIVVNRLGLQQIVAYDEVRCPGR